MVVTVRTPACSLSNGERSRIARALGLALAPYSPRIVRAVLRLRRNAEPPELGRPRVQITVPLLPAGVVRVEAGGADATSAAREAIRRAVAAVARRLAAERQELLEFLLLASVARGEPTAPTADGRAGARRAPPGRSSRRCAEAKGRPSRAA